MTQGFANSASGIPLVGDWNGDGIDTVGIYIGNAFKLVDVNESASTPTIMGTFGIVGDIPVVGDWDGDGYDTLAVIRGNTWFFSNTRLTGTNLILNDFSRPSYGLSSDKPLAGDWDGDGIDTVGVFRPSTAEFILSNTRLVSGTQPPLLADIQFGYGISSDIPIVGSWNGKPVPGPAVFRGNTWLQRYSLSSGWADASFGYGISTDKPVAGRWTSVCAPAAAGMFAPACLQATPTITPTPTIQEIDAPQCRYLIPTGAIIQLNYNLQQISCNLSY